MGGMNPLGFLSFLFPFGAIADAITGGMMQNQANQANAQTMDKINSILKKEGSDSI